MDSDKHITHQQVLDGGFSDAVTTTEVNLLQIGTVVCYGEDALVSEKP